MNFSVNVVNSLQGLAMEILETLVMAVSKTLLSLQVRAWFTNIYINILSEFIYTHIYIFTIDMNLTSYKQISELCVPIEVTMAIIYFFKRACFFFLTNSKY